MNCGLANLHTLKRELLLAGEVESEDALRDEKLAQLGLGVARLFDSQTARKLTRAEDEQVEFEAARSFLVVPRYPIESVSLVELRSSLADGFVEQEGQPLNFVRESGIVKFGGWLGDYYNTGRITYTGGYFVEELEPDDDDYPSELPDGAEAVPQDLVYAWILQCKFFWERSGIESRAKAGVPGSVADKGFIVASEDLLDAVKLTLNQYRRLA